MSQNDPDETGQRFPRPPSRFTDHDGRAIEIRTGFPRDALAEMYDDFAPSSRAQGLPPVGERRIQEWLDVLEEGVNVVTSHVDDQSSSDIAVGHACLLDCGDGTSELTIFVHQDYQLAGIGSRLIRGLLGAGQANGVERIWLTVERSNHVAMNLYRSVGFETSSAGGIEHEMELQL
jgi:GNAT superfamily N-acetyltransferase